MQHDLQSIPALRRLAHILGLDEFVYNVTVPGDAFFIHQLDEVDIAACSWLSLINGVNLNVFRGFASEEDAVDYFLDTAYGENVSVLASKNTSIVIHLCIFCLIMFYFPDKVCVI